MSPLPDYPPNTFVDLLGAAGFSSGEVDTAWRLTRACDGRRALRGAGEAPQSVDEAVEVFAAPDGSEIRVSARLIGVLLGLARGAPGAGAAALGELRSVVEQFRSRGLAPDIPAAPGDWSPK